MPIRGIGRMVRAPNRPACKSAAEFHQHQKHALAYRGGKDPCRKSPNTPIEAQSTIVPECTNIFCLAVHLLSFQYRNDLLLHVHTVIAADIECSTHLPVAP